LFAVPTLSPNTSPVIITIRITIYLFVVYLTKLFEFVRLYSVEWMGNKWMMNWKGFWRKRSWPNSKVLSWYSPGGTEENHEQPQSG
jgi:hypothetical protein